MSASNEQVIDYMKKNGIYGAIAEAAGVTQVLKDATAGDVHTAGDGIGKPPAASAADVKKPGKKAPAKKAAPKEPEEEVAKVEILKAISAADVVFEKGEANLYVSRPLTESSAERLHAWAEAQGIQNLVPPELMHSTQVHSTAEVDTDKFKPLNTVLDIDTDSRWLSKLGKGDALVMFFRSPDMQARFKEAAAAGASWDFPTFMPHITLSYDAGGAAEAAVADWGMMEPPDVELQLGPEVFAQSNSSWVDDNGLVAKNFELVMKVSRVDDDQHIIGGWASIASVNGIEIVDKQGDIIPVAELEKAFHEYVLFSRAHGDMHESTGSGDLIACMTFTAEKAAMGLVAKNEKGEPIEGTWVEYLISDMGVWKRIKNGELPEFSIGGTATPHTV